MRSIDDLLIQIPPEDVLRDLDPLLDANEEILVSLRCRSPKGSWLVISERQILLWQGGRQGPHMRRLARSKCRYVEAGRIEFADLQLKLPRRRGLTQFIVRLCQSEPPRRLAIAGRLHLNCNPGEAANFLARSAELRPHYRTLCDLAWAQMQAGDRAAAIASAEEASRLNKTDSAENYCLLARLYSADPSTRGRARQAAYEAVLRRPSSFDDLNLIESLIKFDSDPVALGYLHLSRAVAYNGLPRRNGPFSHDGDCYAIAEANISRIVERNLHAAVDQARKIRSRGEREKLLAALCADFPDFNPAFEELKAIALDYEQHGELARAMRLCERLTNWRPEESELILRYGLIAERVGDGATARRQYYRLLTLNPYDWRALSGLASVYSTSRMLNHWAPRIGEVFSTLSSVHSSEIQDKLCLKFNLISDADYKTSIRIEETSPLPSVRPSWSIGRPIKASGKFSEIDPERFPRVAHIVNRVARDLIGIEPPAVYSLYSEESGVSAREPSGFGLFIAWPHLSFKEQRYLTLREFLFLAAGQLELIKSELLRRDQERGNESKKKAGPLSRFFAPSEERRLMERRMWQSIAASDRLGLLACNDLKSAISALFKVSPHPPELLCQVQQNGLASVLDQRDSRGRFLYWELRWRIGELIRFWISEEYAPLRQRITRSSSELKELAPV